MTRGLAFGLARTVLGGFGLALVAYAVALVALHPSFIYPFSSEPARIDGFEMVTIAVPGAEPLPVLVHDGADGAPVVLYFMGNAGSLAWFEPELAPHRDSGRNVVAMTYRGGGGVAGRPSEPRLKEDALAVADWAASRLGERITVLHGYSLGSGLALHVAARRPVDQVILSAPYARLCELMSRASRLPACLLPFVQRWDSLADVPRVTAPVLILHGAADEVIPYTDGLRLGRAFPRGQASVVPLEGAGHEDMVTLPAYWDTIELVIRGAELRAP